MWAGYCGDPAAGTSLAWEWGLGRGALEARGARRAKAWEESEWRARRELPACGLAGAGREGQAGRR